MYIYSNKRLYPFTPQKERGSSPPHRPPPTQSNAAASCERFGRHSGVVSHSSESSGEGGRKSSISTSCCRRDRQRKMDEWHRDQWTQTRHQWGSPPHHISHTRHTILVKNSEHCSAARSPYQSHTHMTTHLAPPGMSALAAANRRIALFMHRAESTKQHTTTPPHTHARAHTHTQAHTHTHAHTAICCLHRRHPAPSRKYHRFSSVYQV